jgi:hypothetical protein
MAYGYSGGDSELELVRAATRILNIVEDDAIEEVKQQVFPLGDIFERALARKYCTPTVAGWCAVKFDKSDAHFRQCLRAWKLRHVFDSAVRWMKGNDCTFRPKTLRGPKFCIELCQAYLDRNKSESQRLNEEARKAESRRKSKEAKEAKLRAQILRANGDYKRWFDRLAEEHRRWATEMDRDPRTLIAIETEIAEANGADQNGGFEFASGTDGTDEPVEVTVPEPDEPEPAAPEWSETEPTPGQCEILKTMTTTSGIPLDELLREGGWRKPEPQPEPEPPQHEPKTEPEPAKPCTTIVPFTQTKQKKDNPWAVPLKDVRLTEPQYDIIKGRYVKGFKGKRGDSDHMLEGTQVRFYHLVGEHLMPAQLDLMQRQRKNFWSEMWAKYDVTPSDILAKAE